MSDHTRDAISVASSSRLPLEIILAVAVSFLVILALTMLLLHRVWRINDARTIRLAHSPSLLRFSDLEANRQWLESLKRVKALGLGSKPNRTSSLSLQVKCRGDGKLVDDMPCHVRYSHPQNAFFPAWRRRSSLFTNSRKSCTLNWSPQSSVLPFGKANASRNKQIIPEIRITVPPTAAIGSTAFVTQGRRWSSAFRHDIGVVTGVMPQFKGQHQTADHLGVSCSISQKLGTPTIGLSNRITPTPPTHRRFARASLQSAGTRTGQAVYTRTPLSPISEDRESWCSSASHSSAVINKLLDDESIRQRHSPKPHQA